MIYNNTVRDYFFSPQHVGIIDVTDEFTVMVKNKQKDQGIIVLYMQCQQNKLIHKMRFKSNGNPYLIASLEWLCRQIEGVSLNELPPLDYQFLIKELAIPRAQYPLALRVVRVFQEAIILIKNKFAAEV